MAMTTARIESVNVREIKASGTNAECDNTNIYQLSQTKGTAET